MFSHRVGRRVFKTYLNNFTRQFGVMNKANKMPKMWSLVTQNTNVKPVTFNKYNIRSFCAQVDQGLPDIPTEEYLRQRYMSTAPDADLSIYENVSPDEIEQYVNTDLMEKYGYSEEDIDYLMYFNPKVALPPSYEHGGPVNKTIDYFETKLGTTKEEAREILLRYPIYMRLDKDKLEKRIQLYMDLGINSEPLERHEVNDIFKADPFYLLCPLDNYPRFIAEFKKYRFTKEETIKVLKEATGVLGFHKGAVKGLFDTGK